MPEDMALWRLACDLMGWPPISGGADDGDAGADRDTPQSTDESGPTEEGTPADEQAIDWEQRYANLQPEYTRATQEAAQYREYLAQLADPETAAEALAALGYEMEDDEDEDEDWDEDELDDTERLEAELDTIKEYLVAQEDAATEQEVGELEQAYMDQQLDALEQEVGELPDEVADAIGNLAFSYVDEEGLPDVAAAYMAYAEASQAQQQAYLDSKQAAVLYEGTAGVDKVNLNDADERAKAVANIIEATQQIDEG